MQPRYRGREKTEREPEKTECNLSANITRAEAERERWKRDRKIEQKKVFAK